jgi:hypothetical protein
MSTLTETSSPSKRSGTPHFDCKLTKEELLNDKKAPLSFGDDCPICLKRGVACEAGCHPSQVLGIK